MKNCNNCFAVKAMYVFVAFTLFMLVVGVKGVEGQTANTYTFATGTGQALLNPTFGSSIVTTGCDDCASSVQNIGFTFVYEGNNYTQFSVSSNGLMRLGGTAVSTAYSNDLDANANNPKIMPLWDDLNSSTDGGVRFGISGSAPNRILVVDYRVRNGSGGGVFNCRFQVWLYETTNVIRFVYETGTTPGSFSCGIGGSTYTNYQSVTTNSQTCSNSTTNDANSTWPGSGRFYAFTPPALCTGTPNAGTATGTTTGCPSTSFTMTTSGLSSGLGITYLWETSPNGSSGWASTGVTTANLTTTTATTAYYRLRTTCSYSGLTNYTNVVSYTVVSCSSVNVPSTGNNNVACGTSTLIYDHGGSGGNYSSNVSGYTVLENGYTGVINLTGSYITESSYDYLRIYAGVGTGGTLLGSYSGTGTITPITSPAGQALTIQFTSDVSAEFAGISLTAIYTGECVEPCVVQITDNTIYANGNADEITVSTGETFTISSSGGNTSGYCYWASNDGGATWSILTQTNCNMPSFNYSLSTVGQYIFHVRNYDGCGYCWDAAHGPNCTCGASGSDCVVTVNVVPLPGENCSNAQDLSTLTSPYAATTVGYADDIATCRTGYADRIFYIEVPYLYTLNIGEASNSYDEYEYVGYGPTCGSTTQIQCWDNDGLAQTSWLNNTGSSQTVWYIQDAFSGSGTFNLQWNLVAPPPYVASYISMNTGAAEWCPGETRTVSVTIQNIGSQAWADGGGEDFNIGVKWNADPDYIIRVDAQNLASGATQTFNLNITAPTTAGSENLTFNVVREGISWFGGPYTSAAQTIKPLPTAVSAGSDAIICSGSSTQLIGSASATGSATFNFTASGFDGGVAYSLGDYVEGVTSGMPAGATITSITYTTSILSGGTDYCGSWWGADLYVNGSYSTAACNVTNQTYSALNGQPANNQTFRLWVYDIDGYNDAVDMGINLVVNYAFTPTFSWTPIASLDNSNIYNPTATPSTTTTYTMTANANGCTVSDDVTVNVSTLSTAPTAITGTTSICPSGNTTLTTSGGSLGTDATDVWYSGSCGTDIYNQPWTTQTFGTPNSTVNSVSGGILNITSLNGDPMIDMAGLGNFDPNTYKYIQIRYRVTAGTAGGVEIFFYNDAHNWAVGGETGYGSLISDGAWHVVNVDMSADPEYTTGGLIHGWRFDWCTAAGVTMDIDYISLSDSPIIGEGSSINVSPTVNTTYYTAKRGACNTTACASATVSVYNAFTAGAINTTGETICYGGNPSPIGSTTASSGGDNSIVYEWRANGVAIGSTNSATYTPPTGLTASTTYTRWAHDGTCNTTFTQSTGSWLVTVRPEFTPGAINTTGETICYDGDPAVIGSTTASSGGDNSITYEWRANGTAIGSSNSATYNPPANLTTSTTYTRWAKDATCNTTFTQSTGSWVVTVRPNFTAGSINTTGETICQGDDPANITSSVASSGGDNTITYKWQANGIDIAASNSADFNPPAGLLENTTYTRWAKDNTCNTGWTQSTGSWTVTVTQAPYPAGIAAGDYFWTGANNTSWDDTDNWLYYDGSDYSVATVLPTSASDVFIQSYSGTCAITNAITSAASTVYCEDLNIETGLTLGGLSTIEVTGDWNNSGTFVAGTGTVIFNGSAVQTINSGGSSFNNILFDNSSAGNANIEIAEPMSILGLATFTDGIVYYSGTGSLTFGNTADAIVSSNNSFVDGPVTKTGSSTFIFPVGDISSRDFDGNGAVLYQVLGAIRINPSAVTNATAEYFFSNSGMPDWWEHSGNMDASLHHVSDREYWIVNADQNMNNMSLYWYDNSHANGDICIHGFDYGNPADFVASDLALTYWTGTLWRNAIGTVNGNHDQGYITSDLTIPFGFKAPTYITFGSKNNLNPLPVELSYFDGECKNGNINLNWQTASETNNSHFLIQVSDNMKDFETIGKIYGAGNSSGVTNYDFSSNANFELSYYRLIQTDFDGKTKIYPPISISCKDAQSEPTLSVHPNPFESEIYVILEHFDSETARVEIINPLGQTVSENELEVEDGFARKHYDLSNLKPGMYQLRVISGETVLSSKIIKK